MPLARFVLTTWGMFRVRYKKFLCRSLVFIMLSTNFLTSVAYGGEISFVIRSVRNGSNDADAEDVAEAVRQALPLIAPAHVVANELAEKVIAYYADGSERVTGSRKEALEDLSRAKEHYFHFQYDVAMAEIAAAVEVLSAGAVSENGSVLHDALITQGVIARSAGRPDLTRTAFERAVRLNPFYRIDYRSFPPSIIDIYEQSRNSLLRGDKGSIRVETDPPSAEVFINGIMQGVTPLSIDEVPAGSYSVLVRTNKYQPVEKNVKVASGERIALTERLRWTQNGTGRKAGRTGDARAEIAEGLRIADLLKVDKAVLIDCDGDLITARMIDSRYKASHKPIVVDYPPEQRVAAIADLSETLAELSQIDLLANPMKYLDPEGLGDPILLTGRKKELYKRPFFWGAIGTAAAGALIGGILAATSGGSSGDTGSVAVQFK